MRSKILVLFLLPIGLFGQTQAELREFYPFELSQWTQAEVNLATTFADAKYLSDEEVMNLFVLNLIRINPRKFGSTILLDYAAKLPIRDKQAMRSLQKQLHSLNAMEPLEPSKQLFEEAKSHAQLMGKLGKIGHDAPGKSFKKRLEPYLSDFVEVRENINYGLGAGWLSVIDLLVDQNVAGYGHRKTILHPDIRFVGIAIRPHKKWDWNTVQVFGGEQY